MAEFLAGLWQGEVPESLTLHKWLYVDGAPRTMLLLWDGDDAARAYIDEVFGDFGPLTTEALTDGTPGLAACFDRDLAGFGTWLTARGAADGEVARQLDVRRRGLQAPTRPAAVAAGRAWADEQGDAGTKL